MDDLPEDDDMLLAACQEWESEERPQANGNGTLKNGAGAGKATYNATNHQRYVYNGF